MVYAILISLLLWAWPAWAVFPETALLSACTGSDGTTPVPGFGTIAGNASVIYTNACTARNDVGNGGYEYWTATTFTQPIDITAVYAHKGANGQGIGILLAQNPGATWDGYIVYRWNADLWVSRYDNGVETTLNSLTHALNETDVLGMRVHTSGHIELFINNVSHGTFATDTTYTGEFYAGYWSASRWDIGGADGQAIDDLSAGEAVEDETSGLHLLPLTGAGK